MLLRPGRGVQEAKVSAALQHREQQQATGRFGKIRGPWMRTAPAGAG